MNFNGLLLATCLLLTLMLAGCRQNSNQNGQGNEPTYLPEEDPRAEGMTEDYLHTNRGIWQKPELVMELLGPTKGKTIADIGAGTGFFALPLAAEGGKVIAIDIEPWIIRYLDSLRVRELPSEYRGNLEPRLAEPDDPKLEPGEADIALIVNTYMYIDERVAYLEKLKQGIAGGGKILIIDFKKKRTPVGPPSNIRIPLHEVEEELYAAGFEDIYTNDTALDYQYIIMAEKPR
ncbi:MAG: class I SAM-dependent methyltransferase [Saprospiraceae bacterium]|nr:class I SAM-dependent methyltransferase [Saprospiraceae bacterium]